MQATTAECTGPGSMRCCSASPSPRRPGFVMMRANRPPESNQHEIEPEPERKPEPEPESVVPAPSRALPAPPRDVQEPAHEHEPRPRIRRGQASEAALPALPRGEGEGRPRAHHVRRLLQHRAGLAFRVRPDLHRRRLDHSRAAGVLRAYPPPRLRDHVPDHPYGASHPVERRGLAAAAGALGGARARAPLVPQGDGPRRHPAGGARVR